MERASSTASVSDSARSPGPVRAQSPLTSLPFEIEEAGSEARVSFYVQAADEVLLCSLAHGRRVLNIMAVSARRCSRP